MNVGTTVFHLYSFKLNWTYDDMVIWLMKQKKHLEMSIQYDWLTCIISCYGDVNDTHWIQFLQILVSVQNDILLMHAVTPLRQNKLTLQSSKTCLYVRQKVIFARTNICNALSYIKTILYASEAQINFLQKKTKLGTGQSRRRSVFAQKKKLTSPLTVFKRCVSWIILH